MKYFVDIYRGQPFNGMRLGVYSRLGKARKLIAAVKALAAEADESSRNQFCITLTSVEEHVVNKQKKEEATK